MAQEWKNNGPVPPNGTFGYNFENGEQALNAFAMDDAVFDEFLREGFDDDLEILPNALGGARGALEAIVGESLSAGPVEPKGQDEVIVIPDDDNEESPFLGEQRFAVSAYGTHFLPDQLLRDKAQHPIHLEQLCLNKVLEIFPDICREYAKDLLKAHGVNQDYSQKVIDTILDHGKYPKERDTKKDLKRKREERENTMSCLATAKNAKLDEEDGAMCECKCCYSEYKFSEVTHCGGEVIHFFCLDCARRYAENEMGLSRWRLTCIDPSGCKAPFERSEINRFLSRKSTQILDRLQQQEELSAAGLEGLTSCPFCDFSGICESVDIDKEFRCMNPECEKISCRLCLKETHVPLTCDQHEKDSKLDVRHAVEEAMSEALFRKCSKCGKKYIKEHGCNKMTCPSCRTVQCYICSAVLDPVAGYNHFNDTTRGGKKDGCALFDDSEKRHNENVAAAEKAAIAKIQTDNPELSEEELRVKLSKRVADDEAKRLKESAKTNARMGIGRALPGGVNGEVARRRVLEERHRAVAAPAYPHPVQWVYEQPAPPLPVMEEAKNPDGQFALDHFMGMADANLDYLLGLDLDQEVPAIPVAMPVGLNAMRQAAELEGQVPLHIRQQGQQQIGALIDPLPRMDAQQQLDFQTRFERLAALRVEHEAKQLLERKHTVQRARGRANQRPGEIIDYKKHGFNTPGEREARLQATKDRIDGYKPPNDQAHADNLGEVRALLAPTRDKKQRQVDRRAPDQASRFKPARMLANLQQLVHHPGQGQVNGPDPQQASRAQAPVDQQLVPPAGRAGYNVYNEPMPQPDGRLPHLPATLNLSPDARARYIAHPSSFPPVPALNTASATSVHAGAGAVLGPGVAIGPGVNFGEIPHLQRQASQQQRERLYEHMGMMRPSMNERLHIPGRRGEGPAGP